MMILILAVASMFLIAGTAFACDGAEGYTKTCDGGNGYTRADDGSKTTDATMASASDKSETTMLSVSNMTCGGCVSHVTKSLAAVDGVSDVTVSLDKGTAEVAYDADKVKPKMLTAAVVKAGYPAKLADADMTGGKTADAKSGTCDPAACAGKKSASKSACLGSAKTAEAAPEGN